MPTGCSPSSPITQTGSVRQNKSTPIRAWTRWVIRTIALPQVERVADSMTYVGLRGLPPLAPLARAASDLASERTFPPLRPKATAAGFLRGIGASQSVSGSEGGVVAVASGAHLLALCWRPRRHLLRQLAAELFVRAEGVFGGLLGALSHALNTVEPCGLMDVRPLLHWQAVQQPRNMLSAAVLYGQRVVPETPEAELDGGAAVGKEAFRHGLIKPDRLGFVK